MTDVAENRDQAGAELPAADEQVLRELTGRARAGGLKLTGPGGLPGKLTKMVVEGAPEGELDDHLGYGKHDPAGRDGGNSRNGRRAKTVLTDTGPVEISVPRDRDSPEPRPACSSASSAAPPAASWPRRSATSPGRSSCCATSRPCSRRPGCPRTLVTDRAGGVADGGGQGTSPHAEPEDLSAAAHGSCSASAAPIRREVRLVINRRPLL